MKKQFSMMFIVAAVLFTALPARADLTFFGSRSALSLTGTVGQNYGFEDLDTSSYGHVYVDPLDGIIDGSWTAFGVTYLGTENVVFNENFSTVDGQSSGAPTKMLANNLPDAPIVGIFAEGFSLFGFDVGGIWGTSDFVDIHVATNLSVYSFLGQSVSNLPGLSFFGYQAGAGEFFTAFSITATAGTYVAIDNMTLGTVTAPVPEPEIYAMLVAGLGFLGWAGKRRKRQAV